MTSQIACIGASYTANLGADSTRFLVCGVSTYTVSLYVGSIKKANRELSHDKIFSRVYYFDVPKVAGLA